MENLILITLVVLTRLAFRVLGIGLTIYGAVWFLRYLNVIGG